MPRYTRVVETEDISLDFDDEGSDDNTDLVEISAAVRRRGGFARIRRRLLAMTVLQAVLAPTMIEVWEITKKKYFWHAYFNSSTLGTPLLSMVYYLGVFSACAAIIGLYVQCRWTAWVR